MRGKHKCYNAQIRERYDDTVHTHLFDHLEIGSTHKQGRTFNNMIAYKFVNFYHDWN
jgi:hypothetical protein